MTFGWTSQVKVFRVGGEQTLTLLSSPSHPRLAILSSVPSEPIVTVPVVPSPGVGVVPPAVAVSAASAASSSAVPPVSAGVAARRPPSLGPATVPRASIEPAVEPSVAAIVRPASNRARVAVPPAAAVPAAAAAAALVRRIAYTRRDWQSWKSRTTGTSNPRAWARTGPRGARTHPRRLDARLPRPRHPRRGRRTCSTRAWTRSS